jgi:hypothetical protein
MSTVDHSLWAVETAEDKEILFDQKTAYQFAETFQSDGKNVEVWYDGKIQSKLKGKEQYRFVF